MLIYIVITSPSQGNGYIATVKEEKKDAIEFIKNNFMNYAYGETSLNLETWDTNKDKKIETETGHDIYWKKGEKR